MTRPELAVLLAYAKRSVYTELLEVDLPDSEYLAATSPATSRRRSSSGSATSSRSTR